ncbi:MarR family transcriptional regulator [Pasteurella multocida]|nr:MarR family transcriptional regulator [Pasteurella multocida]
MSNFDKLGKQIGEVDATMDAWIAKLGLGYNHFAVLYSLAAVENRQCTQKQICEEWLLPKQTVFNVCKEYKEKGWIEFSESAVDKREKIMRLTADGKAKAEPVWQATQQLAGKIFAKFGEKKTAQLFSLLSEFCTVCREQIDKTDTVA